MANLAVQAGDVLGFYGQGIPLDTGSGSDIFVFDPTTPVAQPLQNSTLTLGSAEYPIYPQARTYSFGAQVINLSGQNDVIVGGMKKFVDGLPGLGAGAANNLGQYIPVAVARHHHLPRNGLLCHRAGRVHGKDALRLAPNHAARLPPGWRPARIWARPSSLQKDRPVRILFRNLLPTDAGGNLFIPVNSTVMGSGLPPTVISG